MCRFSTIYSPSLRLFSSLREDFSLLFLEDSVIKLFLLPLLLSLPQRREEEKRNYIAIEDEKMDRGRREKRREERKEEEETASLPFRSRLPPSPSRLSILRDNPSRWLFSILFSSSRDVCVCARSNVSISAKGPSSLSFVALTNVRDKFTEDSSPRAMRVATIKR